MRSSPYRSAMRGQYAERGAAQRIHADARARARGPPRGRSPPPAPRRRARPDRPRACVVAPRRSRDRGSSAASPALPPASSALARSWIQPVTSVSAGPPSGGLYLKPPSAGGLCDGVMTMPSARPERRPALCARMARETAGVGVKPSSRCDHDRDAVGRQHLEGRALGGPETACVSLPRIQRPVIPLRAGGTRRWPG